MAAIEQSTTRVKVFSSHSEYQKTVTAKYRTVSVEIVCPFCDGEVYEPNGGSTFWQVTEIAAGCQAHCENGHNFKLPKVRS